MELTPSGTATTTINVDERPPLPRLRKWLEPKVETLAIAEEEDEGSLIDRYLLGIPPKTPQTTADWLGSVPCQNCGKPLMRGATSCEHCDYIIKDETDWTADDPILIGQYRTFRLGENQFIDDLVEDRDPQVELLDDLTVRVHPEVLVRMTQAGAMINAINARLAYKEKRQLKRSDTYSWWHQGQVDIATKQEQDRRKVIGKCAKKLDSRGNPMYPGRNPFVTRLEQDDEFLAQMCLRDQLSSTPELFHPEIQQTAIQVAQRLGRYAAILEMGRGMVRGARGEDSCPAETLGDNAESSFPAFVFTVVVFALGMLVGWILKWYTGRKAHVHHRNMAVQSQCTYTEVRGSLNPRFLPLPDNSHGANAE